jgi:hypothetical protein
VNDALRAALQSRTEVSDAHSDDKAIAQAVHGQFNNKPDFFESASQEEGGLKRITLVIGRLATSRFSRGTGNKGVYANAPGLISGVDNIGHLVPEAGVVVSAEQYINSTQNLVAENDTINKHYKKAFETFVAKYAEENPRKAVYTMHRPVYDEDAVPSDGEVRWTRPVRIIHYLIVDGKIVAAITIENPPKTIADKTSH